MREAEAIGERIRRLRRARAMTQAELAAAAGVSDVTVVRWEGGGNVPQLTKVRAIAKALGVKPIDILGPDEAPPSPAVHPDPSTPRPSDPSVAVPA